MHVANLTLLLALVPLAGCTSPDYVITGEGKTAELHKGSDANGPVVQSIDLAAEPGATQISVVVEYEVLEEPRLPDVDECLLSAKLLKKHFVELTFAVGRECTWPCNDKAPEGSPERKCWWPDGKTPPLVVPIKVRP
jgi:hypothetical protein